MTASVNAAGASTLGAKPAFDIEATSGAATGSGKEKLVLSQFSGIPELISGAAFT